MTWETTQRTIATSLGFDLFNLLVCEGVCILLEKIGKSLGFATAGWVRVDHQSTNGEQLGAKYNLDERMQRKNVRVKFRRRR